MVRTSVMLISGARAPDKYAVSISLLIKLVLRMFDGAWIVASDLSKSRGLLQYDMYGERSPRSYRICT